MPILIAGPTASGKSGLALDIAERHGGVIVNADALQVFDGWRVLTARPPAADLARAPHALFGHVPFEAAYSVGAWLSDVAPHLGGARPIVTGGTGLYFQALTRGLAAVPPTPPEVRAEADGLPLRTLLDGLDRETRARIDPANRARVQRAWEVLRATGRPLRQWQRAAAPPLLPLAVCTAIHVDPPKPWLDARAAARFDAMLKEGLLQEAALLRDRWTPDLPSSKAIGAADLMAHLDGALDLDGLRHRVVMATRQYAKRQRTWFRSRTSGWLRHDPSQA